MSTPVHLRAGGVSVLFSVDDDQLPAVVHWGHDLSDLGRDDLARAVSVTQAPHRSKDGTVSFPSPVPPQRSLGWTGTPGISGHRDGAYWSPMLSPTEVVADDSSLQVTAEDEAAGLRWHGEWLLEQTGLLRMRHHLTNLLDTPYDVDSLLVTMPVPKQATELLDLTGRWIHERHPQRHPFVHGTFRREGRHGRTGHDATLLLTAGTPGFGFRSGAVWSVHVAWSGDHLCYAERNAAGESVVGAGELLSPGEMRLETRDTYSTPWVYAAWSGDGLDGVSNRIYATLRDRRSHPRTQRPVVLNTWEAVYFDHDIDKLASLADKAAELGVERFVLDDGWFLHRRNDRAGLGDWYVDPTVWPHGLRPIIDHVRGLGMDFGLWVEPEMVNLDSDLARQHPDWILATLGRLPQEWRHQQVLDLSREDTFTYILDRLDALLGEYDISYLKWDHNRDLIDVRVHEQTLAVYALLDEVRRRHPGVEIESCSSGGARIDLGILNHTDRVWASDTNDALERQQIQRWTGLLLPPELVGSHIGPSRSHTTGRRHDLDFRAITAMFGHFGIEWDITALGEDETHRLAAWVEVYKQQRSLIHHGAVVRVDSTDPAWWVHAVVAHDQRSALCAVVAMASSADEPPGLVRLAGLDPTSTYTGKLLAPDSHGESMFELPGSALMHLGWRPPPLPPESALLLRLDVG